ncbi:uncharacterized protein LOC112341277 isoform X1 [Selaginella moellendorffii]|uniref:uncharacterized protein LOC112341277 isoform X1 n=1 Tax=Selaginella moellendorffii TaxID=88036 RepID=UPI000D1CC870|nr:uncharacterized protein LOC112341277 isoform X1 [Selaginella moellendorffii]XP_024516938.1 uncharacterized protein LOC112341277 isoform X1 [Selaginella moellendorffii]XP_024516939.1 uncharacterized protein LOC112341277 isoform X1 [Selaginella moellendorffii]|eukprot:XP_024516937.1 uncharacterized protein LOC112341277 isoform X1 [Selaginella moellendorffii]
MAPLLLNAPVGHSCSSRCSTITHCSVLPAPPISSGKGFFFPLFFPCEEKSMIDLEARISVAASTGRLDLSDCGLEEIPAQVFGLSELVDLSVAGNRITNLPEEIYKLKNLQRLGLAGNSLRTLPESIGTLTHLQGLWVHGNLLHALPPQIGKLEQLRFLALAGNQLAILPETLSGLKSLEVLSVAGNNLIELPSGIGSLCALRILAVFGNLLFHLPSSIGSLPSLQELWLQGNSLESLPSTLDGLVSLKQLCIADNQLQSLPRSIGYLQALESLSLYGNNLHHLPPALQDLKSLRNLWLEGNPFQAESLCHLPDGMKAFGVSSDVKLPDQISSKLLEVLSVSDVAGTGDAVSDGGYFKLHRYNARNPNWKEATVLVVAFGSAPGVPNWGGLLSRVKKEMEASGVTPAFDILYVVDSWRSWYTQNKEQVVELTSIVNSRQEHQLGSYYKRELEAAVESYKRVVMLGDSMGATAALRFSRLATSVLAFCPQVDLESSSIRPGKDASWLEQYKQTLLDAVRESNADISVHCGSWSHDCAQARILPDTKVTVKVHSVNTHRLAKELDSRGSLVPLIRSEIEKEMSY